MNKSITVYFPEGKKVYASIDTYTIKTDQREKNGGSNSAPSPFILFLSALGTCAGYYALEFCQSRSLSTDGMNLDMSWEFDVEKKKCSKIIFSLQLPDGFPEKFNKAIIRSMELCTVKKHLSEDILFDIIIN